MLTNRPLDARLGQIRLPILVCLDRFGNFLRVRAKRARAATGRAGLASMSKEADAKSVKDRALKKSKCIFCRIFIRSARSAAENVITKKRWRLRSEERRVGK